MVEVSYRILPNYIAQKKKKFRVAHELLALGST